MSQTNADQPDAGPLARTPLHALHLELGARMVPFAGYEMPVQYKAGILKEHGHTRAAAGLFDVSHMGQAFVMASGHDGAAAALEALVPGDIAGLRPGAMRYSVLLNDGGGIIDDLIVSRSASTADDGTLMIVVNAARVGVDYAHIAARLPGGVTLAPARDRALIALQGPKAAEVMARHCPQAPALTFMTATSATFDGVDCHVSRSGYTGEDGFEISLPAGRAEHVARALLADAEVAPIGLGARDTLRLEAGLCLYGHDIDETTSPVEAGLAFTIARRRRETGGFSGAARILAELADGTIRTRVGLTLAGKAPARDGATIVADGREVGAITSGGFSPTIGAPIAMGYIESALASPGTKVEAVVRGKPREAEIAALPLVAHRYVTRKG